MRKTRLLLSALLALGAGVAHGEEGFMRDQQGCKVANPHPKPGESVEWSGQCLEGYADGQGTLQWFVNGSPGTRYEGTLHGGLIAGHGKLTMPDGASYDGSWLAGKPDGRGIQSMPDGTRYEGEWKDGQPDGRGTMRTADGKTLEGMWKEGIYQGSGTTESK